MKHQPLSLKRPLFIFLVFLNYLAAAATAHSWQWRIPRLSPFAEWKTTTRDPAAVQAAIDAEGIKTFYYKQTLDHFNYRPDSYKTFRQRYMISSKYWGGAKSSAPIVAYLGAEAPLDPSIVGLQFLTTSFKALIVYIEHRYYGESVPFGSRDEATNNASTFGYFNSAQALADYAAVLMHVKKTLHAPNSPVIVVGGSYGGMLAAWFRLKYPHVAIGALASSAPVLYFDNITPHDAYYNVVTRDFREASETCYKTILKSWSEIDRIASQSKGLSMLSHRFNTCQPLTQPSELKDYLKLMYVFAAQYNQPPTYPVSVICGGIGKASFGKDIISKIYAGVVAREGTGTCRVNGPPDESETAQGWPWQTCSEMVFPMSIANTSMFEPLPFDLKTYAEGCKQQYGVSPRPHWATTYYGGYNIKLILKRFGSNIIFSNGLKDPYSSGGVLNNISDNLVALHTVKGSHCLDILPASTKNDPGWLVEQRKKEVEIIKGWITHYYADLKFHSK